MNFFDPYFFGSPGTPLEGSTPAGWVPAGPPGLKNKPASGNGIWYSSKQSVLAGWPFTRTALRDLKGDLPFGHSSHFEGHPGLEVEHLGNSLGEVVALPFSRRESSAWASIWNVVSKVRGMAF